MRVRRPRAFVPVAAVAASTVFLACHRGDSILLVEVAGDVRLAPASFQVSVQPAQAAEKTFRVVPKNGATVTLPASLSIEMAPNLTGPVAVTVGAYDVNGLALGYGSTTQTDINVGGETIVVVTLTPSSPLPGDAGMDALTGTGGSGPDASGAGGAGGSGAGGSGGAAGSGAAGSSGTGGIAGSSGSGGAAGKGGASGSGGKGGSSGSGGSTGSGGMGMGGMAGMGMAGASGTGGAAGTTGTAGTTGSGGAAGSPMDASGPTDAGGDI